MNNDLILYSTDSGKSEEASRENEREMQALEQLRQSLQQQNKDRG